MKMNNSMLVFAATLAIAMGPLVPAVAQQPGTSLQRSENARAVADLRMRIGMMDGRIAKGVRGGAITRAHAAAMRRQLAQTQTSMTSVLRRQGFVSAAEFASYNRSMGALDVELDRLGVARRSGRDGLVGLHDNGRGSEFRYDCQNEPVAIAIPGDRLDNALAQLRLATQCPISGTHLARGKRSRPLVGTMTPTAALQAMLSGTGLEGNAIKGGFEVTRLPR